MAFPAVRDSCGTRRFAGEYDIKQESPWHGIIAALVAVAFCGFVFISGSFGMFGERRMEMASGIVYDGEIVLNGAVL